ncbi:MAG TPA: DUF1028 domain-containing protein [Vicinamibacterales bacterium]|nr:DUF1028 domain-containing protein [Vicinamibacterales bacterium]
MRIVVALLLSLALATPAFATFSIVAFDPATGDLGVAVASRVFAVGNHVPWAEAGVGAVATQAAMNGGYGPRGLELLRQGLSAQQVVDRLLAEDTLDRKEGRQVAVVDAKGNVAVYTGPAANEWKGHIKGVHYSVQGNILTGPHVAAAMAKAFESTQGELAEKLYAALKAGDDAGGDRRGRQSASVLVVRKGGGSSLNNDRLCYINVDDHLDPLLELGRLLPLQLAWSLGGKRAPLVQQGKFDEAMTLADKLVRWAPKNGTHRIHQGFLAYLTGNKAKAIEAFTKAQELDPNNYRASFDGALGNAANAAYKKVLDDKEFVAQLPK